MSGQVIIAEPLEINVTPEQIVISKPEALQKRGENDMNEFLSSDRYTQTPACHSCLGHDIVVTNTSDTVTPAICTQTVQDYAACASSRQDCQCRHLSVKPPTPEEEPHESQKCTFLSDVPKRLTYDGKGRWRSFLLQFQNYADACQLQNNDRKIMLVHCLSGKALDLCVLWYQSDMAFSEMIDKLENRFGPEMPEIARDHFNAASQMKGESLFDWSDRVRQLAVDAFSCVSTSYCTQLSVEGFCLGLLDVKAGISAMMSRLQTLEEAVQHVKLYQHYVKMLMSRQCDVDTTTETTTTDGCGDVAQPVFAAQQIEEETVVESGINMVACVAENPHLLKTYGRPDFNVKMSENNCMPDECSQQSVKHKSKRGCWKCGRRDHFAKQCPARNGQGK